MTTRTKYLQIFAFWGNVYQFRLVLSNTLVEVGNYTHRKLGFWKQNFHAILCDLKVLNDTHILRNCVYQKIYFVESIFWSVQYYWQSSFSNWMNLLTIREFTQRLSVLTNHSSRHSFYLYHLWPLKKISTKIAPLHRKVNWSAKCITDVLTIPKNGFYYSLKW